MPMPRLPLATDGSVLHGPASGLWDLASRPKPGMSRGSSADAEW
jgi:hypothetical protein